MTCQHHFTKYLGDRQHRGVECLLLRCGKCEDELLVPVFARDRQECRVCGELLYGDSVCDQPHCQAESGRKNPCKFERLRNER